MFSSFLLKTALLEAFKVKEFSVHNPGLNTVVGWGRWSARLNFYFLPIALQRVLRLAVTSNKGTNCDPTIGQPIITFTTITHHPNTPRHVDPKLLGPPIRAFSSVSSWNLLCWSTSRFDRSSLPECVHGTFLEMGEASRGAAFVAPLGTSARRFVTGTPLRRPRSVCLGRICCARRVTRAVFLPPGGITPLGEDEDEEVEEKRGRDREVDRDAARGDIGEGRVVASPRVDSIDRFLEDTTPEYETWVSRNQKRSLTTFRGGAEWTLGADELNESMRPSYLDRHRHVLAPDEAFGAIFMWDVIVSNSRELELRAWTAVAEEENLLLPDLDDMVRAEGMAPEAAVSRVFYWTEDWGEIKRLVFRKSELYEELHADFVFVKTRGLEAWLDVLSRYGVKCILCASRPRARVLEIVEQLGISRFFTKNEIVSSEDEYETMEQMFLVASLKAERPPSKCVVFTDKPMSITAGHEVSSKVVALIGAHPAYEIKTADQTISDFGELVVYNIRRLFSETGMEVMDLKTEPEVDPLL